MPEIAEAFTLASGLAALLEVPLISGVSAPGLNHPSIKWPRALLTGVEILNPRSFIGDPTPILWRSPEAVSHIGKVLRLHFERSDYVLDFHFGMSGRLGLVVSRHDRVRLSFDTGEHQLHYIDPRKFGWLEVVKGVAPFGGGGKCASLYRFDDYAALFKSPRAVRDLLTDQRKIAGLGNYMVNEVLWKARVHPFREARTLDPREVAAIATAVAETILDAARAGGATLVDYFGLNGDPGMYAKSFNVYRKTECPRCGGPIVLVRKRKSDQSSFICPKCTPPSI
jgi:formamidopyrimidine-DNA glycosylase